MKLIKSRRFNGLLVVMGRHVANMPEWRDKVNLRQILKKGSPEVQFCGNFSGGYKLWTAAVSKVSFHIANCEMPLKMLHHLLTRRHISERCLIQYQECVHGFWGGMAEAGMGKTLQKRV